jgi:hypothetical protein
MPAEVIHDLGENGPRSAYAPKFGAKAAATLAQFGLMLQHWGSARGELSVLQLFDTIVERISYRGYLIDGSEEGEERWDNVLELRATAAGRPEQSLAEFLQDVALMSDQDTLAGDEGKGTVLLTLHAAKGLEFPVVFILGLDEGLLPHQRSFDDPEAMHEERRLMYVGMTRAKDRLYLLRAFRRSAYGDSSVPAAGRRHAGQGPARPGQLPADDVLGDAGGSASPGGQGGRRPGAVGQSQRRGRGGRGHGQGARGRGEVSDRPAGEARQFWRGRGDREQGPRRRRGSDHRVRRPGH